MSRFFKLARLPSTLVHRQTATLLAAARPVAFPVARTQISLQALRWYSADAPALSVQQIEDRVLALLRDFDKVDRSKLTVDAHFVNDLGLDSLDQVEITMALEDEFNIEIPDRDAEQIFTPREAINKILADKNAM